MAAAQSISAEVKHGFYSRAFRQVDLEDLEQIEQGLLNEVAMLRVATRRVFEVFDQRHQSLSDPETEPDRRMLADLSEALNALGLANIRVANLLKTNFLLTGGGSAMLDQLWEELIHAQREKGLTS